MKEKSQAKQKNSNLIFDLSKNVNFEIWEERECPICGCHFYARKKYKKITCSEKCHDTYIEQHKDEINRKRSESLIKTNSFKTKEQKQEELQKARKTCLAKYGVDMYQKTEEYRDKMSKIFKEKDWSSRSEIVKKRVEEKYEKICNADDLDLIEFRNRFDATVKCRKCGNVFDVHVLGYLTDQTNHGLCRKCNPNVNSTKNTYPDVFVKKILDENMVSYFKNDKVLLDGYEVDFLIPSLSIGFEINGNYWHSEISHGKGKNYHIEKTRKAYEKGVKLIQIFEDEIVNKPEIVKSRILNLLGKTPNVIYARNCSIKEINGREKKSFMEKNHVDGDSVSKYNIALEKDGEIVSVVSFGKRKISKSMSFELIRFATKTYTNVVGGFSKMLKYFIEKYDPEEILTYADIRWSGMDNESIFYAKNGFKFEKYTSPNYFYEDKKNYLKRLNRMNFQKNKLVKEGFDPNKTEAEIMFERGFDRIWDCGSMRFIYKKGD